MAAEIKNYLAIVLKSAISFGLLVYLFSLVDLQEIAQRFEKVDYFWLSAHVFLALLAILVSSWKWWLLCQDSQYSISYLQATRLYFVGLFYNHFLPTSVGGDVIRGYELIKRGYPGSEAYATIFAERYTGLATLVAFVLLTLPYDQRFYGDSRIQILALILTLGFIVGSWMVFSPSLLIKMEKFFKAKIFKKIFTKIHNFQIALLVYRSKKKLLLLNFLGSFAFYIGSIFIVYTGLKSLDFDLSVLELITAVPVMLMLFLLPISLGGIGLQEWAHTFVMATLGVPLTVGVSLGLLFRVRSIFFGSIGGVFVLIDRKIDID